MRARAPPVSVLELLSGKTIAGWPSGSSIDSEDTLAFCALTGVRPRVEVFPLERAEDAFARVMQNRIRFRAVLTPFQTSQGGHGTAGASTETTGPAR